MEKTFTEIYEQQKWGNNNNTKYKGSSGGGSFIEYNTNEYIPFLKEFFINNQINTVVDLGCGDFKCGPMIYDDTNIIYTGYDVYKKLIDYNKTQYSPPKYNFIHLDFLNYKENIINADVCILKDVLQHWSLENIYAFLDYIVQNKIFKYILITNCCHQKMDNTDIVNGKFRNLSCDYFPLKKYNPIKLLNYNTKEVCVIQTHK